MEKMVSPHPALFRVFGPRTRTHGRTGAAWRKQM